MSYKCNVLIRMLLFQSVNCTAYWFNGTNILLAYDENACQVVCGVVGILFITLVILNAINGAFCGDLFNNVRIVTLF